ncbi:MAG: hypothetical protein EKK40_15850 [Bradyrhizobiaceae bacterium]|nr:MAG: hypothetical protein EKK40_15850 [Bradyrhizobiaceae bacterium]
MTEPSDLLRRADELSERAAREDNAEVKERLLRMAAHYVHIAESEEWLASHPTTIVSIGDLFLKK